MRAISAVAVLLGSIALHGIAAILTVYGMADVGLDERWQARGMAIAAVVLGLSGLCLGELLDRTVPVVRPIGTWIVVTLHAGWLGFLLALDADAYVLSGGAPHATRAVLAAPSAAVLGGLAVLLHTRPRPGRCVRCGYDRHGLAAGAPCPECGGTPVAAESDAGAASASG